MFEQSEIFGKYQLVERLAIGGMAEVFKARTQGMSGFERTVAIKRLHAHLSQDDDLVQMLVDEARLAVQLQHPNIGQVFDLGRVNGQTYIAMEYIPGVDMHRLVRRLVQMRRPLPIPMAIYVLTEMLAGLEYAHNRLGPDGQPLHIVHRDISPQNIMFSTTGGIKLVDFGIAKARMQVMQTQAGIIKGKFYYMSPEQAHGQTLDRRSDVFASGMVLYELLTGRPAYEDAGDVILLKKVRACDFPPPSAYRSNLPEPLVSIVMHALHKSPRRRIQSAREFRDALLQFAQRHYQPVDTFAAAEFVRGILDDSPNAPARPEPHNQQELMQREEFSRDEQSLIFDASHLAQTDHGDDGLFAEASLGAGPDLEDNPFAGAEEPTQIYAREDDDLNPFAVPGDFAGPEEVTDARRQAPSSPNTGYVYPASGGADEEEPTYERFPKGSGLSIPPADRPHSNIHGADPQIGPREHTVQTDLADIASAPGNDAVARVEATLDALLDKVPEAVLEKIPERAHRPLLVAIPVLCMVLFAGILAALLTGGDPEPESIVIDDPSEATASAAAEPGEAIDFKVTSEPAGANVIVDGHFIGQTPYTLTTLRIGETHEITLEAEGYQPYSEDVTITEAPEPFSATLEALAPTGRIHVVDVPEDARVFLNDEEVGEGEMTLEELSFGDAHVVEVIRADGARHSETVTLTADDAEPPTLSFEGTFEVAEADAQEDERADDEDGASTERRAASRRPRPRRRRPRSARSKPRRDPDTGLDVWGGSSDDEPEEETAEEDLDVWGGSKGGASARASNEDEKNLDVWGGGGGKKSAKTSRSDGKTGYLTVRVIDGDGKVYINGKMVSSKTPLTKHSLAKGRYRVKVYFPMLKRYSSERTVEIAAGKTRRVIFKP